MAKSLDYMDTCLALGRLEKNIRTDIKNLSEQNTCLDEQSVKALVQVLVAWEYFLALTERY